jgi:hypothetical protein
MGQGRSPDEPIVVCRSLNLLVMEQMHVQIMPSLFATQTGASQEKRIDGPAIGSGKVSVFPL